MQSRQDVYQQLHDYLVELFEVPSEDITPDARLFEDLDLDSIDAVPHENFFHDTMPIMG